MKSKTNAELCVTGEKSVLIPKCSNCTSAVIAPVLSEILNTSIRSATYPSKLKTAKITPVYLRVTMILTQTTELFPYFQILIEYLRKSFTTD